MSKSKSNSKRMEGDARTMGTGGNVERRFWTSWYLLIGMSVLTTIGLSTAMRPLLGGATIGPWPWARTEYVLLVGISILVSAFAAYLTHQQRQNAIVRQRLQSQLVQTNERTRRHYTRLLGLLDVSRIMNLDDPQSIFDSIANVCMETFECDQASVMIVDREKGELEVRAAVGHVNIAEVLGNRQMIGDGIAGWAARYRKPTVIESPLDGQGYPGTQNKDRGVSAAMVVPIITGDDLVGVLNISSRTPGVHYDAEDLRAIQVFAENAGTCIRHAEEILRKERDAPEPQETPS